MLTIQNTAFFDVMGDLTIVPLVSRLPSLLPAALAILVLFNYFDICAKMLNFFGIKRFQFRDSFTDGDIERGKDLLKTSSFFTFIEIRKN